MPEVFTHKESIFTVGDDWLQRLKDAAEESPLRRSRLCLHLALNDSVQEMIIALCQDVLFQPHRHEHKTESFHIIDGELDLVIFDDHGTPIESFRMGPPGSGNIFCYRLNAPLFHALLPRTPFVVFHETTMGPFQKSEAIFAPWAPTDRVSLRQFIEDSIRERAL